MATIEAQKPQLSDKKEFETLNMTVEKERPSSPVHLHVDDETPVHVHVKGKPVQVLTRNGNKNASLKTSVSADNRLTDAKQRKPTSRQSLSNLRRSTASSAAKTRSRSPPWIPPPAKTTSKYTWQGASHRLDICTPSGDKQDPQLASPEARGDLDTEEEDDVTAQMRQYEETIGDLMTDIGALKSERNTSRSNRTVDDTFVVETGSPYNAQLRRDRDFLRENIRHEMFEREKLSVERDCLMQKLVEVEMDGRAAAEQVSALRTQLRSYEEEQRLSQHDFATMQRQRESLLERLTEFEATNRTLRAMLRERHEQEANAGRVAEQRDLLLKKLTETETRLETFRSDVVERERRISELEMSVTSQQQENVSLSSLQKSLEATRAHLQKTLRQKEADCNRMAVQIRSLESQLAQEKIDVQHLTELLSQARDKAEKDKEALKKATRVQKKRATKSEDAVEQLTSQLLEREQSLAELTSDKERLQSDYDKLVKEKIQTDTESVQMRSRLRELEAESATRSDSTVSDLQEKISECARLKMELESSRATQANVEDKILQAETDNSQLRSNLRQYETLVEEYRGQLSKSRRETDEAMLQLEDQKRETSRIQCEGDMEVDKVKGRLQARLHDLEPLPELLKTTELRLFEAQERLAMHEKKASENAQLIAQLTAKLHYFELCEPELERQGLDLNLNQSQARKDHGEKQHLAARMEAMDKRLRDLETQNRELLQTVAKREESIHQTNLRLDEKSRENATLARQLEQAVTDTRRVSESAREKNVAKVPYEDRAAHARIVELEGEVSAMRSEVARLRREKEEAERKFNSRLYDLKDRLEQSHSTNRSMHNYVHFLKNSYANVFGDAAALSLPHAAANPLTHAPPPTLPTFH